MFSYVSVCAQGPMTITHEHHCTVPPGPGPGGPLTPPSGIWWQSLMTYSMTSGGMTTEVCTVSKRVVRILLE